MPKNVLYLTREFSLHFSRFRERADPPAVQALLAALSRLDAYPWDGSLSVVPHGSLGDGFAWEFQAGYVLTFKRRTEWDENRQPARIHLYLKAIHWK